MAYGHGLAVSAIAELPGASPLTSAEDDDTLARLEGLVDAVLRAAAADGNSGRFNAA